MITQQFKPGDLVRVLDESTGEISEPVLVQRLYGASGGVRLEQEVFGYDSWNERDCLPA